MKVDHCLILSAGFGTRMGSIGEVLPKALWPIFEKKMLEVQIAYAKSLGVNNIFVNSHHCHYQVKEFINQYNNIYNGQVKNIFEPTLLGTGGAIQNLALLQNFQGTLLYIAVDQFYIFDREYFNQAQTLLNTADAVLFGLKVARKSAYNRLVMENDYLRGIEDFNSASNITFSGLALIDLEKLDPTNGFSSFFDTVANYKRKKVAVLTPSSSEYWDFGTSHNYFNSCFNLLKAKKSLFLELCSKENVINLNLWKDISYGKYFEKNIINFSQKKVFNPQGKRAIILDAEEENLTINFPGLYFNGLTERIEC